MQGTAAKTKQHFFNRAAIKHLADTIETRMNLLDIKALCEDYLLKNGADSFWYWDVGNFIVCNLQKLWNWSAEGDAV